MSLDVLFPPVERVIFEKNPLVEVVCEVKYPVLAEIDASPPSHFQQRLRQLYPLYHRTVDGDGAAEVRLFSTDGLWQVVLRDDYLSLNTTCYECWEEFSARWDVVWEAFLSAYPSVCALESLALIYVDVLDREAIGCGQTPWGDLLQGALITHILPWADAGLRGWEQRARFDVDNQQALILWMGWEDASKTPFMLSGAFVKETRFDVQECRDVQEQLREYTSRVFCSFLTDTAYQALAPRRDEDEGPRA